VNEPADEASALESTEVTAGTLADSSATSPRTRHRSLIVACVAATWVIWGSTYLAIKFALRSFPPFFQMGTRFVVAGALLLLWSLARGRPMPTLIQWRNATIVGTLMLGAGMASAAYAEQTVASGLVVAFVAIMPAIITLANWPFGLRPSRREAIGIAIGMLGVFLLVRGAGFAASPAGLAALAIGATGWASGSVLSQQKFPLAPSATGFASEMLCGGIVLLVLSGLHGERFHWPPEPLALGAWIYLVIFGSLIAFNAYMILLANASAALATSYSFVNPVIAMLLGIALGGEVVTHYEWMSVGVIVIGVTMLVLGRR